VISCAPCSFLKGSSKTSCEWEECDGFAGLSIAGAIGILVALAFGGTASADTTVWNVNVFGPPRAVTAGIEAMAELFKKESNGTFEMKIAYGAALGPSGKPPSLSNPAAMKSP
jgi:hypothetical protein